MSPAQREAMAAIAAGAEPVQLATATARILHHRYGYIEPTGDGWQLTPRGRAHLAAERAGQRHREVEDRLSIADRDWARRIEAWMQAHECFDRSQHGSWRYARHVAACDHAGIEPARPAGVAAALAYVELTVRATARILRDFDEAAELAKHRGVGLTVSYGADEKLPQSRREAARAAGVGRVVDLRTYRERRPAPRGDAA